VHILYVEHHVRAQRGKIIGEGIRHRLIYTNGLDLFQPLPVMKQLNAANVFFRTGKSLRLYG